MEPLCVFPFRATPNGASNSQMEPLDKKCGVHHEKKTEPSKYLPVVRFCLGRRLNTGKIPKGLSPRLLPLPLRSATAANPTTTTTTTTTTTYYHYHYHYDYYYRYYYYYYYSNSDSYSLLLILLLRG